MLKALAEEGYETPTPIQAQAIPAVLKGADLLGIAQTGTGKTAAFALPLLHRLAVDPKPAPRHSARILVLSPTRELAAQIGESFRTYGRHLGIRVAIVFGGVAHKPQIDALSKGVDVLVATPGRLLDHLDSRVLTLEAVEALVLDEADQMLDLGFVRPIRRIVSKLRARRQNLFFSATMPQEIAALAAELLKDPVRVQVAPVATTAERVTQRVIHIEANKKRPLLVDLFGNPEMQRTLVFTRTKRGADRVARHLEGAGIAAVAIHGNKSQRQREVALDAFRRAKTGVLVATDIAARGIDIDGVTHVVNFELPEVPEAYVHRIGRTARAGAEGQAISLCDVEERDLLRAIERLTRQQIPAEDRRNDASIVAEVSAHRSAAGRRQGGRAMRGRGDGGGGKGRGELAKNGRRDGRRDDERRGEKPTGERRHDERSPERPTGERRSDERRNEVRRQDERHHERDRSATAAKSGAAHRRHGAELGHGRGADRRATQAIGAGSHRVEVASDGRSRTGRDGAAVAHVFATIDKHRTGSSGVHSKGSHSEGARPKGAHSKSAHPKSAHSKGGRPDGSRQSSHRAGNGGGGRRRHRGGGANLKTG